MRRRYATTASGAVAYGLEHERRDDAPREDGTDRIAVYVVTGGDRRRLAETSVDGVGLTLLTLASEGEFRTGLDDRALRVGLLDRLTRVWIVNPWAR